CGLLAGGENGTVTRGVPTACMKEVRASFRLGARSGGVPTQAAPHCRFGNELGANHCLGFAGILTLIEIEVQNETTQTQERLKFLAVPRIGEGLRLREPDGT